MNTLRRFLLAFLALLAVWLALPATALAQDIDPTNTVAEIRLSALVVTLLVSALIPLVNGLITTLRTATGVKIVVTLILQAVNALVTQAMLADGSAVLSQQTLVNGVLGLVVALTTYGHIFKPLGLTSSMVPVRATPGAITTSASTPTPIVLVPGKLARVGVR